MTVNWLKKYSWYINHEWYGRVWFDILQRFKINYEKATEYFSNVPYSQSEIFKEFDIIVYLKNTSKWREIRDRLINIIEWIITEKQIINIDEISSIEDIIKLIDKTKLNSEITNKILVDYGDYIKKSLLDLYQKVWEYYKNNIKQNKSKEAKEIIEEYYKLFQDLLNLLYEKEIIIVKNCLWITTDSIKDVIANKINIWIIWND